MASLRVIVTGAASGIGAELARRLLLRGDRVLACDINLAAMDALRAHAARPDQLQLQALDVRDPVAWQRVAARAVDTFGGIDVLANVAGVLKENWVVDASAAEVDFQFDINVKGTIFGMQAVLPSMLAAGRGHIVNIASLAGLSPVPGLGLYSASKFAVRGYSLAAAMELAARGIAVTAVCPDAVQTPMLDIQKGKPQTALTFSGRRALGVSEVVDAILGPVLRDRPMEIALPLSRGLIAKFGNAFPALGARALAGMTRSGLKRQQQIAAGKDPTQK